MQKKNTQFFTWKKNLLFLRTPIEKQANLLTQRKLTLLNQFLLTKWQKQKKLSQAQAYIYIQKNQNNTLLTLTDLKGQVLLDLSSGKLGLTGPRKGTKYASELVAEKLAKKALDLQYRTVFVVVRGIGYGKPQIFRALKKAGLQIVTIQDKTPTPHNGCRPRKSRDL